MKEGPWKETPAVPARWRAPRPWAVDLLVDAAAAWRRTVILPLLALIAGGLIAGFAVGWSAREESAKEHTRFLEPVVPVSFCWHTTSVDDAGVRFSEYPVTP